MSQVRHMRSLPSLEEVLELLETASDAANDQFNAPKYSYVHKALPSVYLQSIVECIENEGDPVQTLIESLQDERLVLDRHNHKEVKTLFKQETIHELSEDPENFPLRYLATNQGMALPSWGLQPIYQVNDHPDVVAAAREARSNAVTVADSNALSLHSPSIPASKDKLCDAPSPEHDFPDGNITLAEIAAFIPQSIKCWDVVDRILWNGAKTEDIKNLFIKYREMPAGNIVNNSVYMMMRGQMDKRSEEDTDYKGWTVGAHQYIEKPDDYDPASLSVTGFRRPTIFKNRPDKPAPPVPFKDLAEGVAMWPEHGDALDLTRIVKWCAANPDEEYYYPTDFQKVLRERLDGSVTPQTRHIDAEVLSRLRAGTGNIKPRHRAKMNYKEDDTDESEEGGSPQLGKRKRSTRSTRSTSSTNSRENRRQKPVAPLPRSIHALRKRSRRNTSQMTFNSGDLGSDDDTDDDAYQGPKRIKKNKGAPRRSERNLKSKISYADESMQIDDE